MGRRERHDCSASSATRSSIRCSPAMHNAAFAAAGLPHLYLRYRVAPGELAAALDEARRLGIGGLNLTVPLKEAVLPLLDALTPRGARGSARSTRSSSAAAGSSATTPTRAASLRSLAGSVRLAGGDAPW